MGLEDHKTCKNCGEMYDRGGAGLHEKPVLCRCSCCRAFPGCRRGQGGPRWTCWCSIHRLAPHGGRFLNGLKGCDDCKNSYDSDVDAQKTVHTVGLTSGRCDDCTCKGRPGCYLCKKPGLLADENFCHCKNHH